MKIMNIQTFNDQLELGEEGEKIIGELLLKQGYFVQPLYQYKKDRTPYIFYYDDKIVKMTAPDITVFKDGIITFVECKLKHQWVRNWDYEGRLETGLNNKHLQEYLKVYKLTKIPVEIYWIHEIEEPTGIYRLIINEETFGRFISGVPDFRRISYIPKHYDEKTTMSFFDIEDLEKIQ